MPNATWPETLYWLKVGEMKVFCLTAMLVATAVAQTPSHSGATEFEAVSVKVEKPAPIDPFEPDTAASAVPMMRGGPGTATPGRIRYSNVTLMDLITKAYELSADQVLGPRWMSQGRYSVDAVVPPTATKIQFQKMLQNLLLERFKLTIRWEERSFKVYKLVVAEGGPRLKTSAAIETRDDDEDDAVAARVRAMNQHIDSHGCPVLAASRRRIATHNHCTTFVGWSIPALASTLGMMVAVDTGGNFGPHGSWAHVIDETGLDGRFDFSLDYDISYHSRLNAPGLPPSLVGTSSNPVSIFQAVQAQLGLKLEPSTSKLKAAVI